MANSQVPRPRVSVRIPAYNHEKYIAECLRSVLDQTFTDFEIVITDDGSTDRTVDIIRSFDDPRIKLVTFARNEGCNVAIADCGHRSVGEYIANLCSDDVWELDKLEKQVRFLDENLGIDAVFTKVRLIDEEGEDFHDHDHPYHGVFEVENRTRDQWLRQFFLTGNCLCMPSVLIRSTVYRELCFQDCRMASLGDFDLWVRFCMDHDLHIIDERLTRFRIRANESNASGNKIENHIRVHFEYKQIMDQYLSIQSTSRLLDIFPECADFGPVSADAIPYLLGRRAIETTERFRQLWGLETIFRFMADEQAVNLLREQYGFRYKNLHGIASQLDTFALRECLQKTNYIHQLETELNGWEESLLKLRTDMEEEARIWAQRESDYAQRIASCETQVAALTAQYAEACQQRESAQREATVASEEIRRMKATLSWRVTSPLRWIRRNLKSPDQNFAQGENQEVGK